MIIDNLSPRSFHYSIFDAMVLNYNTWILPVDPSIEQKYWDAIHLAKNLTGVNAVILVTYPSNSKGVNSTSIENWRNIYATNQMIRKISAENNQLSYSPRTLVLDFAKFANQMFWLNARSLGFNVSDPYHVAMSKDGNSEMTSALFFNPWKRSVVVSASVCPFIVLNIMIQLAHVSRT